MWDPHFSEWVTSDQSAGTDATKQPSQHLVAWWAVMQYLMGPARSRRSMCLVCFWSRTRVWQVKNAGSLHAVDFQGWWWSWCRCNGLSMIHTCRYWIRRGHNPSTLHGVEVGHGVSGLYGQSSWLISWSWLYVRQKKTPRSNEQDAGVLLIF